MDMIKAKRVIKDQVHKRSFSRHQWDSKTGPQKQGWVLETTDLSSEKSEAKAGREKSETVSIAIQEELTRVNNEVMLLKSENETLTIENSELKSRIEQLESDNKVLTENQKGKPGRKPKDE